MAALQARTSVLGLIRAVTGSQCRELSKGGKWENFQRLNTSRAAAFWMRSKDRVADTGGPERTWGAVVYLWLNNALTSTQLKALLFGVFSSLHFVHWELLHHKKVELTQWNLLYIWFQHYQNFAEGLLDFHASFIYFRKIMLKCRIKYDTLGLWGTFICTSLNYRCIALYCRYFTCYNKFNELWSSFKYLKTYNWEKQSDKCYLYMHFL